MKKIIYLLLLIILFILLLPPASGLQLNNNINSQLKYDFTLVDNHLNNSVDTIPLDGCVLLLIKDGQVIYEKAFGNYSLNTVVPIASATKWVSAILLMDLVDDGLLSLDDKVSDWISYYNDLPDKKDITVRQLFSHTSGLPNRALWLNFQWPGWDLERCAKEISKLKMEEPPGTMFRYGGISMQLAGRIVELAANDTWIHLYEERISGPLGITTLIWDEKYPDTKNPRIAGGITAISVYDYSKLLQMMLNDGLYNGVRIIKPETVQQMLSDQTFGVPVAKSPYTRYNDHPHLGYGIGVWVDSKNIDDEVVEMSSTGAWGFHPWIDFNRNMTGVFLVDSRLSVIYDMEVELRILIREIVGENKAPEIPEAPNGPTNCNVNTVYTYSAVTLDPEGDMISYVFDWGDGTNSGWTEFVTSQTPVSLSHTWLKTGTYSIRVKTRDAYGTEGRWSDPLPINMPKNRFADSYVWLRYFLSVFRKMFII